MLQAIFAGKSDTSNLSIAFAPLSPASSRRQEASTPQASGDTIPSPVTTTRLISTVLYQAGSPFRERSERGQHRGA
jgi:hypothetical protein